MTRLPLLPDREERVERISATTYSVTVTRSACAFRVPVTACVNAGARNYSTAAAPQARRSRRSVQPVSAHQPGTPLHPGTALIREHLGTGIPRAVRAEQLPAQRGGDLGEAALACVHRCQVRILRGPVGRDPPQLLGRLAQPRMRGTHQHPQQRDLPLTHPGATGDRSQPSATTVVAAGGSARSLWLSIYVARRRNWSTRPVKQPKATRASDRGSAPHPAPGPQTVPFPAPPRRRPRLLDSVGSPDWGKTATAERAAAWASFVAELDRTIDSQFTRDYWEISLPNKLDTSAARSPVLFAYWAALNLLDADALFSDVRVKDLLDPAAAAPRSIELHHLCPKKHLSSLGIQGRKQVNAIANMAYLDWSDNAAISGANPVDYWPRMTANQDPERLRRQARWHALPVGWEQLDYSTFLERRRPLIAQVVRRGFETIGGRRELSSEPSVVDLLSIGESRSVEFKSTARWNVRTGQHDSKMEHIIVKAVCGFLNGEGGTLLIGVDDTGEVLGLDCDFSTLGAKPNADGFELFLRQLLDHNLSVVTVNTVQIRFHVIDTRQVCEIAVAVSGRPVFAKPAKGSGNGGAEFWVRVGNATRQLHGDEMMQYRQEHWG
jgi:hypothetical protein